MSDMHYTRTGDKSPDILLLHGWASSSRMWRRILHEFDHIGRLWVPDLPGHGRTPPLPTPTHIDLLTQHVIRFCDQHHIQPQVIIAHSMGGLITLKLVHTRPDLAQQLVLICPVVTGEYGFGVSSVISTPAGSALLRQTESLWGLLRNDTLLRFAPIQGAPDIAEAMRQDWKDTDARTAIETLVSMPKSDMMPFLTDIAHPTLVMVGSNDLTVPPSEGQTAALYMPNAQLVTFSQAMHRPFDEQPQDFMPTLRAFLIRHGII